MATKNSLTILAPNSPVMLAFNMKSALYKYWSIVRLSWQNGLVYRFNVIMWRFRQLLTTLMSLTIWTVIFHNQAEVFGYKQSTMITYIFLVSVLQSLIFATTLHGLAGRIYSGQITNELIKPINLYIYFFSQDVADKLKNFGFIVVEIAVLYWLFQPIVFWPDVNILGTFLAWTSLSVVLHFFIILLLASLGFWSPDDWAAKFLFFMVADFTAGKMFPLDILPETLQRIINLTPFPFLAYHQTQLFLGRVAQEQILPYTLTLLGWCSVFGVAMFWVWRRGINNYEAVGR